ncbi:unnamed protein product, partial [Ectocarpus sp. 4 AP-2014]
PKVGAKEEVDALLPEYEGNPKPGFRKGVQDLGKRYSALRRVRGDGNCFYRSFLFGYLERLLQGIKSVGDANTKAMLELSRLRQVVHDRCGQKTTKVFVSPTAVVVDVVPASAAAAAAGDDHDEALVVIFLVCYVDLFRESWTPLP